MPNPFLSTSQIRVGGFPSLILHHGISTWRLKCGLSWQHQDDPPTPSATVPRHRSAQLLLRLGQPFVEFPRFSILELHRQTDLAGNVVPISEWLTKRLQIGQPFVIQHFDQLETWDSQFFEIEKLIELSTKKSEPLSCSLSFLPQ
jgi:hypothetical protein